MPKRALKPTSENGVLGNPGLRGDGGIVGKQQAGIPEKPSIDASLSSPRERGSGQRQGIKKLYAKPTYSSQETRRGTRETKQKSVADDKKLRRTRQVSMFENRVRSKPSATGG